MKNSELALIVSDVFNSLIANGTFEYVSKEGSLIITIKDDRANGTLIKYVKDGEEKGIQTFSNDELGSSNALNCFISRLVSENPEDVLLEYSDIVEKTQLEYNQEKIIKYLYKNRDDRTKRSISAALNSSGVDRDHFANIIKGLLKLGYISCEDKVERQGSTSVTMIILSVNMNNKNVQEILKDIE